MAKKVVVVRIGAKTTHIVHMEYMTNNPTIYGCMRIPTPEGAYDDGMIRDVMEMGQLIVHKKAGVGLADVQNHIGHVPPVAETGAASGVHQVSVPGAKGKGRKENRLVLEAFHPV